MSEAWWSAGLRFACTQCGNCCTGEPGTVRLTRIEARAMAAQLGLTVERFGELHTRTLADGGVSLRERPDGACVLWASEAGCTVYAQRPRQCRTWPFWRDNLRSPERWREVARGCPGIGDGPLHAPEEIVASMAHDGTSHGAGDARE